MLLISDANILIDMADGGLLQAMFRLEETFAVPDVLFEEELETRHPELPELGLISMTLQGEGVVEAYRLKSQSTGRSAPSQNDLFALMLAKQEKCPCLPVTAGCANWRKRNTRTSNFAARSGWLRK